MTMTDRRAGAHRAPDRLDECEVRFYSSVDVLGSRRRLYSRKCNEDRLTWDTYNNTQYHTPYANMTSLSIRLTVPLREVIRGGALAQWTAAARASCDSHVHSPCPCALHAAALVFVATLTSHSARSTRRARVRARAPAEDRRVPPDAPPEGNANVAACPLLSAEATGESKDSSTK